MKQPSPSQIILFYKYIHIEQPATVVEVQRALCQRLELTGRILIAHEGINGTLEGSLASIAEYLETMKSDPLFGDTHFKKSPGTGSAFAKLIVRARSEIVTSSFGELENIDGRITGKYLEPEELHQWIADGKEFYIVDMRNDYEQKVGHFEHSLFPGMSHFRDLPNIIPTLEHLKNKVVLTVCTGGVRCEKASGFLMQNGFSDVYQLHGGIVSYMEQYPNQDFKGKLYVFDNRITMGFNVTDPHHAIVGRCEFCNEASELFTNCAFDDCHRHFICCGTCNPNGIMYCNETCENNKQAIMLPAQ